MAINSSFVTGNTTFFCIRYEIEFISISLNWSFVDARLPMSLRFICKCLIHTRPSNAEWLDGTTYSSSLDEFVLYWTLSSTTPKRKTILVSLNSDFTPSLFKSHYGIRVNPAPESSSKDCFFPSSIHLQIIVCKYY